MKPYHVLIHPDAEGELDAAYRHIAADAPARAARWRRQLLKNGHRKIRRRRGADARNDLRRLFKPTQYGRVRSGELRWSCAVWRCVYCGAWSRARGLPGCKRISLVGAKPRLS
jgi:plasmid stabilization system protein ParE